MKSSTLFFSELILCFIPFMFAMFLNRIANVKKENRCRQYIMPVVAVIYCVIIFGCIEQLSELCLSLCIAFADFLGANDLTTAEEVIRNLCTNWAAYVILVVFNTLALLLYVAVKLIFLAIFGRKKVKTNSTIAAFVGIFYYYDEVDGCWYIQDHYGQARTFIKTVKYGAYFVLTTALMISCHMCVNDMMTTPFYPVFAMIVIGEIAFFVDGLEKDEKKSDIIVQTDKSTHIAMYPKLRKPLRDLFGDKLAAEGTTVNNGGVNGGSIDDILVALERTGGHIGENYSAFIRKKMESGLKPNIDYVHCGYDLAKGKSLLFNTPFYDKLNPYIFYAMNHEILAGGKILIVLGRHGTEQDLKQWLEDGMREVSNIPNIWDVRLLNGEKTEEDEMPDIGIVSTSGVHDLDIHKKNLQFFHKVSFVMIVEPSKLITTAQVGLKLLIKCCGKDCNITFCSVDRNCDGLVDALSHILMTNITEVSATEYPHGISSYMYWTADDDYLQHRILPGVSRSLGIGTELSMVALKNQVKKTIWYGGDVFPVTDAHWIAKQYYYDLLDYAQLPTNQETFDNCFRTSFNMCNERVSDYSFITVEDDRNNLFETRRNFATISEQQGFINVISSEYMLREYMASNADIFTADPKAIPYITADYARTKRNAILSLCLLLCLDSVSEEELHRQLSMLNVETKEPASEIWKEICIIFSTDNRIDEHGNPMLSVKCSEDETLIFEKNTTIIFRRAYSIESGKYESIYTIEDKRFLNIILDDLQNAAYIAEEECRELYMGAELKGHVYQKYMPGQFFTLNGKYYEMLSAASDNRILVRRASEHIGVRLAYRQVRNYTISHIENSNSMGAQKSVNNIKTHYQFADFSVETPGYWKLSARNDFNNGDLVKVNGVPTREYHHKQILKLDFSEFGDAFTDSVRMTLTNLLNETFVTLFADNQAFISAVTLGDYGAPLTYSMELREELENADKCIFIIEDSQLDIGLLIAVERNLTRILQIITDYLEWNDEQISESLMNEDISVEARTSEHFDVYADDGENGEKNNFFSRVIGRIKKVLKRKNIEEDTVKEDTSADETIQIAEDESMETNETESTCDEEKSEENECEVS